MPVRKQSDIAFNSADPGDHSIHPRTHLLWHFAARATVAENQPVPIVLAARQKYDTRHRRGDVATQAAQCGGSDFLN